MNKPALFIGVLKYDKKECCCRGRGGPFEILHAAVYTGRLRLTSYAALCWERYVKLRREGPPTHSFLDSSPQFA
eukprot:14027898-Heterocapsa_arctica.AAC.1